MLTTLFGPVLAFGGAVRTVSTDGAAMVPVNLRLGQSTVLRFQEKPKKVVLGNSNYYSIEFIDNDVAIQPLGVIFTNLFVYGTKNVYGFLLRTNSSDSYDDLVRVTWKDTSSSGPHIPLPISAIKEISRPDLSGVVGKDLAFSVTRILRYEKSDFYIVDFVFENKAQTSLKLSSLQVKAVRGKAALPRQDFIMRDSVLKPGKSTMARLLVRLSEKNGGFTIEMRFGQSKFDQSILGKFLW